MEHVIAEVIDPETGEPQLLNAHTPRLPNTPTLRQENVA